MIHSKIIFPGHDDDAATLKETEESQLETILFHEFSWLSSSNKLFSSVSKRLFIVLFQTPQDSQKPGWRPAVPDRDIRRSLTSSPVGEAAKLGVFLPFWGSEGRRNLLVRKHEEEHDVYNCLIVFGMFLGSEVFFFIQILLPIDFGLLSPNLSASAPAWQKILVVWGALTFHRKYLGLASWRDFSPVTCCTSLNFEQNTQRRTTNPSKAPQKCSHKCPHSTQHQQSAPFLGRSCFAAFSWILATVLLKSRNFKQQKSSSFFPRTLCFWKK